MTFLFVNSSPWCVQVKTIEDSFDKGIKREREGGREGERDAGKYA
jgi:hypothetical protein